MIERAEREGLLQPGDTIVEASSGNTGNAMSMVAAAKGYRMLVVMPEGMSPERVAISRAHGADILLVGDFHVTAALDHARTLGERPGYFHPGQFDSEWNVTENREWLGAEILEQLPAPPDALVAGVGTGGTLIGVGQAFRAVNPDVLVVALEPGESRTICCGEIALHAIEGIADGFVPGIIERHRSEITDVVSVSSAEALTEMRRLAREHGIFVGPSSGAHMLAAQRLRRRAARSGRDRHAPVRRGREVHRRPPRAGMILATGTAAGCGRDHRTTCAVSRLTAAQTARTMPP